MAPLARRRVAPALRPSLCVPGRGPIEQRRPRELWLAVHLPDFMLDSLREAAQALPGHPPVAVVDLERNGKVVRAGDLDVRSAGVHDGMSVNAALALLPTLQTLARDTGRERLLLEAVAQCGLRFTPRVSLEPPDGVLLEVRGSLRLFGGARRLCARLQTEIAAATGAAARFAVTPAPLASLWFARHGAPGSRAILVRSRDELPARLGPLPLACARWPERSVQALGTMGVHTVGECLRLPRDGFSRRFGADLLAMLDRATGRAAEPRATFAAREKFALQRDLEPEIGDTVRLEVAIAPMLAQFSQFLRERGQGVQSLEVQLRHRESRLTRVRLRFVQPAGAEPRRIADLLHERLAQVALPAPARNVRLVSGPLLELQAESAELFAHDRRETAENLPQLIERLRARLGSDSVHGLACVPEHRPESAWRAIEPARGPASGRKQAPLIATTEPGRRPLWLLDVPEPCDERRFEIEDGPECIESGWWDGHDVSRDYYVARDARGGRAWIFRHRRAHDAPGWFLHGWFA